MQEYEEYKLRMTKKGANDRIKFYVDWYAELMRLREYDLKPYYDAKRRLAKAREQSGQVEGPTGSCTAQAPTPTSRTPLYNVEVH